MGKKKAPKRRLPRVIKVIKWVGAIFLLLTGLVTIHIVGNLTLQVLQSNCSDKEAQATVNYAIPFVKACVDHGGILVWLEEGGIIHGVCVDREYVGTPNHIPQTEGQCEEQSQGDIET